MGSYGQGSIQQRGDNLWRVVVEDHPHALTGKRRQKARMVRGTKKDAIAVLTRLNAEKEQGAFADGQGATVLNLVRAFMANADLAATTRADYERVITTYLPVGLAKTPVQKVTPSQITRTYAALLDIGISAWRVRRLHDILRSAFQMGLRWEWTARNPVAVAGAPKAPRVEREVPTTDDLVALLENADRDFAVWLRVAVVTGARRGEIVGLQWTDIDLDRGEIRFRRSVSYTPAAGVEVKGTKTGKTKRLIIDPATIAALFDYKQLCRQRCAMAGIELDETSYVFSNDLGINPWRPDLATHRFVRLRDALGLDGVRLHDLRHALASVLIEAGLSPRMVADRLGHANPNVTLSTYAHALPAGDRAASDLIAGMLNTGSSATES